MTAAGKKISPWTPEDDERLRSLALTDVKAREIGMQLNRTEHAVRSRAMRSAESAESASMLTNG